MSPVDLFLASLRVPIRRNPMRSRSPRWTLPIVGMATRIPAIPLSESALHRAVDRVVHPQQGLRAFYDFLLIS
jgi:hypothetical protein